MARALCLGLALLSGGVAAVVGAAAACPAGDGQCATVDEETAALLQVGGSKKSSSLKEDALREKAPLGRIEIRDGKCMIGTQEVQLFGGNYVFKQLPYFPVASQVAKDAERLASDLASSAYTPRPDANGNPVLKVPMVRLGTLFEGMMPEEANVIDDDWMTKLKATVKAFASKGVYVVLDAHSDAWSTTNGGEGFPWWLSAWMQAHAENGESYITSPEHPLQQALPSWLTFILNEAGVSVPPIETVTGMDNPWYNFSVGSGMPPARMNVGNINIRLNNNDGAWERASLRFTAQVQNSMYRFINSHKKPADKEALFMPYVKFVQELSKVWAENPNVIGVELLNEPVSSGIPSLTKVMESRTDLWSFYAAVLDELEKGGGPLAPMAVEDIGGSLPGTNMLLDLLLTGFSSLTDDWGMAKLKEWSRAGRLIISAHYYPGTVGSISVADYIKLGKDLANELEGAAVFLSEFQWDTAEEMADTCREAAEAGADMIAWWHYVDRDFTKQDGWYIYPPDILKVGVPISTHGEIDWPAWNLYYKTVLDGTFYGAQLTGSAYGFANVLALIPAADAPPAAKTRSKPRRFPNIAR